MNIRISSVAKEGSLLVSKWIKLPLLLDENEMEHFLSSLSSFSFYNVQGVCLKGEESFSYQTFLNHYKRYIYYLKNGEAPRFDDFKMLLSPAMSCSSESFYAIDIAPTKWLIKPKQPIIQWQANQIHYSREDQTFRTLVYGNTSISWGIMIGFPYLYQDPQTQEVIHTRAFPNARLFHEIQKWIRNNTLPTPFLIEGKRKNEPIRLGKNCFPWINNHPHLIRDNIQVL